MKIGKAPKRLFEIKETRPTSRVSTLFYSAELMRVNSEPALFDFDNVFKNEFTGYVF